MVTSIGTIEFRFLSNTAPKTVENFVKLATGEQKYIDVSGNKANKPFYDGLLFHRIHPDLGIFSGCPWGTGRGWPGYYMFDENPSISKFDRAGLVAMAKVPGDNRVGSQFFITTKEDPRLNGRYTIFGEVTSGMDVVNKIANMPRTVTLNPKDPIYIKKIEVINSK
ncbi:MAG: peptidylprolyl isomerase [Bdellovibrionaceae bacterium]|nr:peptidylprolyl isomerase [Pseudobdellovibrionaceae bacterium]